MANDIQQDERVRREIRLLELRLNYMQGYHDHKERMAHAVLLVALAVAAFVLTAQDWPPPWIHPIYIPSKWVAFLVLTLVWLVIHWLLRWQLMNLRVAAQLHASLMNTLQKWVTTPPVEEDIKPVTDGIPPPSTLIRWIDFVFPWGTATGVDGGLKGYPRAVVTEFTKTTTGTLKVERVVSYASLFLFALASASTLLR